jgi:hypothetical protein
MKRKVRVKSLPKAQTGLQAPMVLTPEQKAIWYKNQGMFGNPLQDLPYFSPTIAADAFTGSNNTTGNFNVGMPSFERNTSPSFYADIYQGDPNTTGSFNTGTQPFSFSKLGEPKVFENPSVNPFNKSPKLSLYPRNTKFESGILSTGDAIKKTNLDKIPEDTRKVMGLEPFGDIKVKKPEQQKGNPYVGPALLATTDVFSSVARKLQDRNTKQDFRNQFLSDNLYNARPVDYPGNRGDYLTNTAGLGPDFRPDEYIYGDYNKIAQMGGEMKRKVRITSMPQAQYGGTQNAKAVNQLYGNSAYMMNMFNGATKGEPQEQYNQVLTPDPKDVAVLEAEKGETLVRKGTNSTIPELFTIGGKRHSEGGTPLGPEKATPDSFIYSDTKAMKIKDPTILESFGFAAKKGGYTPAQISKKFNLNNKELREGLYADNDPLRKSTSVLMADNYISNLGKLALVQESQKGFPQGVPEIAMPYMDRVGLDPAQFLPPSPEEGMMDPNMQYAQTGTQVKNPEPPRPAELKPYIDQGIIVWDAGKGTYRVALNNQGSAQERFNILQEVTPTLNKYGYKNIVQSGSGKTGSKYSNFYAGLSPQDYEYKIVERNLGKETADKLDEAALRKTAYDIIGFKPNVDISSADVYNDPKFFGEFSRAFYRYLPEKKFRADLGDDDKFGFEHYDAIPKKTTPEQNSDRDSLGTNELNVSSIPRRPIGFYPQDVLNTAAAVGDLASINKYNPRRIQFNAQPMKPTYYDPNRELANNAEMANMAAQQLAQFTGPQAFNSRFSDLQGKGLANAANIEARYNNLNVGVANQFEQANKQLMNDGNFRNQLAANDFYDKTITTNQQFDNSKRQGRRQVVDYANAALDNRFITDQMNSLYPNYFVDPAMLKTFYNPNRQITPQQRGQDMMTYLESTGIPFDFSDPAVQAALLKGIMGDVNVDERGSIASAQAGMGKRRSKTS